VNVLYSRAYIVLRICLGSSFKLRIQLAGGKPDAVVAGHVRSLERRISLSLMHVAWAAMPILLVHIIFPSSRSARPEF